MSTSTINLASKDLDASLELPGTFYRSSRFDWSTMVTSVRLKGRHEFLTREMADGSLSDRRGHGLAAEFGMKSALGFDDCPLGGLFPKIGVGWIPRRDLEAYNFYRHEEGMLPLCWEHSSTPSELVLRSSAFSGASPWAWEQQRTWRVEGTSLVCTVRLENTGSMGISTQEYVHNFLAPGGRGPGPDMELRCAGELGQSASPWGDHECLDLRSGDAGSLGFRRPPAEQFGTGSLMDALPAGGFWWELRDSATGLWMREETDLPAADFALWAAPHVISPEIFLNILVEPGATLVWTRTFRFGQA